MAWKSGQSYSADLRSRVLAAVDGGSPARAVAERFQVSVSYIYKALGRRDGDRRDRGPAAAQPPGSSSSPAHHDGDRGRGGAPSGRHAGRAARLAAGDPRRGREPGPDAQDAGPARADAEKKSGRAQEQDRPDVAEQRADWRAGQARAEPGAAGLRRRDRCGHQHGPALRPQPARPAGRRAGAARPLENHDLRRRPHQPRLPRPLRHRRRR